MVLALGAAFVVASCGDSSPASESDSAPGAAGTETSGGSDAAAEGSGGTLRIAMTAANVPIPEQFVTEGGEGIRFVGVNVYDRLLNWDTSQDDHPPTPIPGLAESYAVADDNLTWTFEIRPGVTFHDGTALDATAVQFSFDRLLNQDFEFYSADQAALGSTYTAQIASYRVVDDMTFEVVTKKPWSFFLYDVALISIVSPTAVQTYGNEEYAQHAVGAGPFKIDRYEGDVMELVPFEDYWDGPPLLDRMILYPRPEPASRLTALQSGEVDWAEIPPPDALAQLEAEQYQILMGSYPHAIVYLLNNYRPPFDDVRVRHAVAYGIDREGMMTLINDVGIPADQYFYEGHPWRDDTFEGYGYDPERAKSLLAEAGYADGFTIKVAHPASGSGNMFPGPMNEKFQQDMAAIGIKVELFPMEWTTLSTMNRAGMGSPEGDEFDAIYFSPNTQAPMFAFASYLTERIPPAGCCNSMGYSNPEADAVMQQAASTFDVDEQNDLLRTFHGMFIRDAPSVPVTHDLNLRVLSPQVHGWIQPQSWWGDFTTVWVDER